MVQRFTVVLGLLVGFSCGGATALAQDKSGSLDEGYFAPKVILGVGGEVDYETTIAGATGSTEQNLEVSYGAGLQYLYPLHRYFALGGLVGLRSWQSDPAADNDLDRNLLLDIAIMPAGRLPLSDDFELYLAVPIGLSLDFWGEDGIAVSAGGTPLVTTDVGTGIGFGVAVLLGARYVLTGGFGLFAELGYQLHSFSHEGQLMVLGVNAKQDFDFDLGQAAINLGVFLF